MEKTWSKCEICYRKSEKERFLAKELVEYDSESWLYDYDEAQFFSSVYDLIEHYEDEELDLQDARIVVCEQRVGISYVDLNDLNDESGTEDEGVMAFYPEIQKKVDELNEMIKNAKPVLWYPTNKRIDITKYI